MRLFPGSGSGRFLYERFSLQAALPGRPKSQLPNFHTTDWPGVILMLLGPPQQISQDGAPVNFRGVMRDNAAYPQALIPTIFHEPWWLDAVSAGRFEEIHETFEGKIVGRLPYVLSKRYGMPVIDMPTLTHFLGPAIDEGRGNETTRLIKRISIAKALIARLPKTASLWMKFHREITDTLAFQDAGFLNIVQFTSEIGPAPDSQLWAGMRDTARRVIRRAGERYVAVELDDPDAFMSFYEDNIRDRGLRNNYDSALCKKIMAECIQRGAGRILAAVDEGNGLHAGVFTVWDHSTEYYLMTTRKRDSDNGAISLLIWNSIKHASEKGLTFDIDGFSNSGDIQFFTRFGGIVKPRYCIQKSSLMFRSINSLFPDRQRRG
jgi:hypothetical protein